MKTKNPMQPVVLVDGVLRANERQAV